jgi:hypothetical protein
MLLGDEPVIVVPANIHLESAALPLSRGSDQQGLVEPSAGQPLLSRISQASGGRLIS